MIPIRRPRRETDKTMPALEFDGYYRKMPHGVRYLDTYIKDIGVIDKKDIPEDELKRDTTRIDGSVYTLPEGRLIWIALWSDCLPNPVVWITHRRFDQERFDYLKSKLGRQVHIIVK